MEPTATTAAGGVQPQTAEFRFHGNTGDYFRIWIVNIALTVVTLGIYSAWAKVRKMRYFYNNTELDGANFDYHARPQAILYGRIIAVALLGLYWLLSYYLPVAGLVLIGLVSLMIPVLVVRALMFWLRSSSYRQIRFGFEPNYQGAFATYYGGVLIAILTLGLGAPYALYMRHRFRVDNARFGQSPFHFNGAAGMFFRIVFAAAGLTVVGVVLMLGLLTLLAPAPDGTGSPYDFFVQIVITLPIFLVYAAIGVYTAVRIRNYLWSNTELKSVTFVSDLSVRAMCWLYLSNAIAIVLSVGLAIPWAQIRLARYRARCTQAVLAGDWKQFLAAERQQASALGEEIGEAFDVGVDLAI